MTGGTILDVVLVALLVGYALTGLRHGLVVGVLSLGGFLGGVVVGSLLLPNLLSGWEPGPGRTLVVLLGVLLVAWALQTVGVLVGRRIRDGVTWEPARAVDTALGAVAALVAVTLVIWLVADALRGGPAPALQRAIGQSRVVAVIDSLVPADSSRLFADFRAVVEGEAFPRVFAGIAPEEILTVDPPDATVTDAAALAAAGGIVKISGDAAGCGRGQEGTGFVVAPGRVVTNAHVVAAVDSPDVRVTGEGERLDARVVLFDPARDLAVLAVDDLEAAPLPLGTDLARGDSAVVAGFPLDGPYASVPARVRQVVDASGEDIYGGAGVVREVYSLFTSIQPGNSGGPLLDPSGAVVGVVFARSLDDASTGYAMTLEEVQPVLQAAAGASDTVGTGQCTTG